MPASTGGAPGPVDRPAVDPDPRPQPPEPPLPSDCCDSGCSMCVHDVYAEELQDYRERLARWRERHPAVPDAGAGGSSQP
ncbi:oxidoreductase-like domain-containing protein [Luteimonas sp. BDR2-5]|uniref:oxidoreductase-like domain-containing protein n=1 Tax=Proluteimonas luteida TaxID=2878685 RepID=UPI001E2E7741|nr:oxidoreductase-like domain-containing protein [Luteimonas sp. BDR2-5]MCD9027851.1 oxidoreductase-like domain-containing protein [Luteimonas sp. BDR2-5]